MDFELSPELTLLQETARSFVDKHIPPRTAKEWDEAHHSPVELLRKMGDLGWFAVAFSEADGGLGGTALDISVISEQLAPASLDVPMVFLGCLIPRKTPAKSGAPEHPPPHLPPLLSAT